MKRFLIVVLFVVLLSGCAEKEQEGRQFRHIMMGGYNGDGEDEWGRFDLKGK